MLWNSLLVLAGVALGSQYETVARYSDVLNYAVVAVLVGVVAWLVARRVRRGRGLGRRDGVGA